MTSTEIANASKIMLGTIEAVAMYIGSTKIWPAGAPQPHDYSLDYFTIESLEDNNSINFNKSGYPPNLSISYSTDNGSTWTDLEIYSSTNLSTINTGDKILIKGINNKISTAWNSYYRIYTSKTFKVYGNTMSLLFGDNFTNNSEFTSGTTHNLCGLFYGTTSLTDASNLILPASVCTTSCYNGMFRGCTNLATAPQLPATNSAQDCYSSMFEGCINLEEAPEINLTNMSPACCKRMFCMSRNAKLTTPKMTKSPILRCAIAAESCYEEMFKGNGNLVELTCLVENSLNAFSGWLSNCSDTGTFRKSPLKTDWRSTAVPSGWTIVDYVES